MTGILVYQGQIMYIFHHRVLKYWRGVLCIMKVWFGIICLKSLKSCIAEMTSRKNIKCVAKYYMEFYILCCVWQKVILSMIIPNNVRNTERVLEHVLFYSHIHRNFTIAYYHINMSYWICFGFFSHVRVEVNMCLMYKDYRFISCYCFMPLM